MSDETPNENVVDLPPVAQYPHGKIGEKEQAVLTKRQVPHIARRAGKDATDLKNMRWLLMQKGNPKPKIQYTVVAE